MQFHFYHASLGKVISSRSYSSFFFLFFFVILRKKNYIKLGRNVGHTFRARLKRSSCNALSCSMIMYTRISWWRYKQNWCNRYITTQYTPNCTRTSVYYVIKRERNKYKSGEEEKRRKKKNSIDNIHTRTNGKGTKKRGWKKNIKQTKKKEEQQRRTIWQIGEVRERQRIDEPMSLPPATFTVRGTCIPVHSFRF